MTAKLLPTVRQRVMRCFSCERYYYHCRKGERPISPEEQQRIALVFRAVDIGTKPKFDRYEYAVGSRRMYLGWFLYCGKAFP